MLRKMISHKTSRSSRTEADLTDCQEDADICFHHNGLAPPFLSAVLFINFLFSAFGLGTMVYIGLEFGSWFEIPWDSPCYQVGYGVKSIV